MAATKGKGKYASHVQPKLALIEGWLRQGLTLDDVAHNLGISPVTLFKYRDAHPELSEALKNGKEVADIVVENALYRNATGFYFKEEAVTHNGHVVTIERYQPPNNTAIIFWLKNRKPAQWRDKQEVTHEVTESLADVLAKAWAKKSHDGEPE